MDSDHKYTNQLANETSPYLVQHAHNPVNWYSWNDEAWNKAKREDKLVLVSIGYSSCHWCHVMEHQTFEDSSAAQIMNDHFVCIKVDREERPDVDQIYMTAVQLMTGSGGWPLNCFCLPDGRPIYGGTYFPNAAWKEILFKLNDFYSKNKEQAEKYAAELTNGIRQAEIVSKNDNEPVYSKADLISIVQNWKKYFDKAEGGPNRAPKFPLPNNYEFLLHYANVMKDNEIQDYVLLTLNKMAFGGIYDHLGGGFARYSTDSLWKAPHFEKMLYDNAQLVSLYSHAYQLTKKELYKDVVYETLEFIEREMTSDEGGFYSALDADSEGEEGKYYVWKKEELEKILGEDFKLFAEYYSINQHGLWENGNYILLRRKRDEEIVKEFSISTEELKSKIKETKGKLMAVRSQRIRPGLDDKQLTSWNALMIKGYCDAYESFGEKKFLDVAIKNANLILSAQKRDDGGLNHSYKKGRSTINGYLEDYAFIVEALIALYQSSFDEKWLKEARRLMDYAIEHFFDEETGMFWFTSDLDPALIARKKEINDNVIPASNSSLAKGLFLLGKYFDQQKYLSASNTMLNNIKNNMSRNASSFSNWAELLILHVEPFYEIVIVGKEAEIRRKELGEIYLQNKMIAGSESGKGSLSLLEQRYIEDKTLIYVCEGRTCLVPVENVEEVMKMITS